MIHIMLISLAYIVGIIIGLYLGIKLSIAFFCLIVCLCIILKTKIHINKRIVIVVLFAFLIGAIYSCLRFYDFDFKYSVGELETEIKLTKFNAEKEYYYVYVCKNDLNDKFLVYLPKDCNAMVGDVLNVKAIFQKPSMARNRGGFDYSKYLYSQNIYGSLKIKSINDIYSKKSSGTNFINVIQTSIYNILAKCFPKDELGILLGMTIGDTTYITDEIEESFKINGISHLLAVSGSNITFVILFSKFIFSRVFGRKYSNYFVILFIIIFMLVSGASASVVRAAIMGIIVVLADILAKKTNVYASVFTSALIILLYNPLSIFDVGFILSFGGTLGIILLYQKIKNALIEKFLIRNKVLLYIVDTLAVTVASQLILSPIMAYYFNSISIISILTNLLIVPFSGILTILGFLIYISGLIYLPVAKILSYSTFILTKLIIDIAEFLSHFKYALITVATPKFIWIIIYYLVIYKVFSNSKNIFLNVAISLMILVSVLSETLPTNYLSINFIDVGQGDCTYIETKNRRSILIDGGGSENSDYDVGEKMLLPYILDRGKTKIDLIIISHFHEDHIEGLFTIIENLKVDKIIIGPANENTKLYQEFMCTIKEKNIIVNKVYAGDVIKIDGVEFEVLYPSKEEKNQENENNNSLVLKLNYYDTSMLFTGDVEKEGEEKIDSNVKADILKVAHHGSKTSSTDMFVEKVRPQIALIGVGENNKFGHPNEDVIKKLENYNSTIFRTDTCGEIMIKIYKNKVKVRTLLTK